jgi:phage shock protein PspC (stress-responsive transcriptional regulator)
MAEKRLVRSEDEKVIAGICGGLADYFGIDPTLVRVAFLLLIPASGIGFVLYAVLMLIMPRADQLDMPAADILHQNAASFGDTLKSGLADSRTDKRGSFPVGLFLILLGAYFLLQNLGWLGWLDGGTFWALLIIGAGVLLISRSMRTSG